MEGELRHAFMVRLNDAYRAGDIEAIRDLIAGWDAQRGPPPNLPVADQLVLVIRSNAHCRATVLRLEAALSDLRSRPDHALMIRAHREEDQGRDLLTEMEAALRARIALLEDRLRDLGDGAGS